MKERLTAKFTFLLLLRNSFHYPVLVQLHTLLEMRRKLAFHGTLVGTTERQLLPKSCHENLGIKQPTEMVVPIDRESRDNLLGELINRNDLLNESVIYQDYELNSFNQDNLESFYFINRLPYIYDSIKRAEILNQGVQRTTHYYSGAQSQYPFVSEQLNFQDILFLRTAGLIQRKQQQIEGFDEKEAPGFEGGRAIKYYNKYKSFVNNLNFFFPSGEHSAEQEEVVEANRKLVQKSLANSHEALEKRDR